MGDRLMREIEMREIGGYRSAREGETSKMDSCIYGDPMFTIKIWKYNGSTKSRFVCKLSEGETLCPSEVYVHGLKGQSTPHTYMENLIVQAPMDELALAGDFVDCKSSSQKNPLR